MTVVVLYARQESVFVKYTCVEIFLFQQHFYAQEDFFLNSVGFSSCRGWKDPFMMPSRCLNRYFIWCLCSRLFRKRSCSRFIRRPRQKIQTGFALNHRKMGILSIFFSSQQRTLNNLLSKSGKSFHSFTQNRQVAAGGGCRGVQCCFREA